MRVRRVHHPGAAAGGTSLRLSPEESRHLLRVLRLGPGDAVSVFDGEGREWDSVISAVEGSSAILERREERIDPVDPDLRVTLFQGACRPEKMDWVVQKGTEIGLASVVPVVSRRAEAGRRAVGRKARWRKIATEACKQSGRRTIPSVGDPVELPPAPSSGTVALLLHPGADSRPLGNVVVGPAPDEVWLAVGPEGGFDPSEVTELQGHGWSRIEIGPRVLRSETAGLVAAAVLLHAWGDLGGAEA
jgi:16S rRNA (uracil1498-N3)-methyltransferase